MGEQINEFGHKARRTLADFDLERSYAGDRSGEVCHHRELVRVVERKVTKKDLLKLRGGGKDFRGHDITIWLVLGWWAVERCAEEDNEGPDVGWDYRMCGCDCLDTIVGGNGGGRALPRGRVGVGTGDEGAGDQG